MPGPDQAAIIGALVEGSRWYGARITFSIPRDGSSWSGYPAGLEPSRPGYLALNGEEADAFRQAIRAWADLIAMPVVETDDLTSPGQIRVAFTDPPTDHSYYPPSGAFVQENATHGDIWLWLGHRLYGGSWAQGAPAEASSTPFMILLHELGHALGLKHPHEGVAALPAAWDTIRYSILSYTPSIDNFVYRFEADPHASDGYRMVSFRVPIAKPMVDDIAAIQSIYGANPATNAGDTTYRWDEGQPFFDSIYDAGGVDTLDLSAHQRQSIVDLTPGAYSSIAQFTVDQQRAYWIARLPFAAPGITSLLPPNSPAGLTYTWTDNVGIAFGTVIENVIGGSGDDTITGNGAANHLDGGAGADRLFGGLGNDTIEGGDGSNYLRGEDGDDVLAGGAAFDDIQGNMGADTEHGWGDRDWVVGGKDNDVLFGDDGDDVINGNLGGDTCEGGAGADIVRGGQANDLIRGQDGNDWLSGDLGDDTITGGAGADTFHAFAGVGADRITDFNRAEGDRILLDAGTTYVVAQVGADTVIEITGGGQVTLVGVQLASLGSGWITAG